MALLEHYTPLVDPAVDEGAARRALRDQIAKLEYELVTAATSVYPQLPLPRIPGHAGPRLLPLGTLEQIRDDLAERLTDLRAERERIADHQAAKRLLIEKMLLDPGHYRYVRVHNSDIGEPGCKNWHVKPRLGIIGMLAGWWHVKISSGCPLAWGSWRTPRPRKDSMGKRSRKRSTGPVRAPQVAPAARPSERRRPGQSRVDRYIEKADARPKPPWHPVPLVELSVLAGIVLLVIGVINRDTREGRLAGVFGLVLASLGGLDTAVRDHFGGFRSHSALLAAFPAVVTAILLALIGAVAWIVLFGTLVVFGVGFILFRRAFKKRAGVAFKV